MVMPSISLSIFILYSVLCKIAYADIELGSTLRPTNQSSNWNSPNNTFSLGFIPVPSTTLSLFSVAISFSTIPIWKAGGDSGVVDSNSRFEFLQNGNLQLINGSNAVLWQSNTADRGVTVATLDNLGNLSLKNGSTTIWSTFENPTDTILPNQNFTTDKTLKSGSYSFNLLQSGNLTLKWNTDTIYWNQRPNSSISSNLTAPSLGLLQTGVLQLYDLNLPNPVVVAYSSDYGEVSEFFRFLRLDSDGNLRIYSSIGGSGNSTERWAAVLDQCLVYGWCGNLGICSYNETNPICGCPSRNFEFLDPNDSRKGCKRKVEISNCSGGVTMLQLDNTRFLTYQPELSTQQFSAGISGCRSNCQVDGTCTASTSLADGTGMCYMKTTNFVSGYHSPALPSISYVKVCGTLDPNPPPSALSMTPSSKTYKLRGWVVAVVVLATLLLVVLLEGGIWFWCCRNSPKFGGLSAQYALLEYASGAPIQFSYKELQRSTKGFKEKLGSGGFGSVYRGILANRTVVAVKQLEGIEQGEKQFRMEVATISSTHHLNLMRLVGFCSEGRHRLLVYEFMKNGSLDNFLFMVEETSGKLLNWETRFNIALGTAKGITYLHEECRDCIVHCDIKPENILLDENYNAKVSDFGLSKLINPKDHRYRTLTSVRGTRGYLAPEWVANLPVTSKSDVYSYGMVLLEIVSGRRNFEVSEETGRKKFSTWAYEEFERGNVFSIVDKKLAEHEVDMEQVMRAVQVSFWCIQEQPSQRPKMGKVVQMLEGITAIEKPPVPKAMTEGSVSGTSMTVSNSVIELSTVTASAPAPSSSSSSFRASRCVTSL
ncbi:Protein kinase domain [Macleaya cordata]|uniref:Receptor-like serine/threonine-protein kinase n=1 Tax=Macleaya cordata TaxID=56857 RepID=A0A200PUV0_MACCD|nr:Protein kinase domain [Macleaya cordata]